MTTVIKHNLEFYEYLDELRRSGVTNMFDARTYFMDEFDMDDKKLASAIFIGWMDTFGNRREAGETGD